MSIRTTIVAGAVTLLLVAPAIAAPSLAQRQSIAAGQVGGTVLSVTPQVGFESALLRVSGPAGYALSKRIPAGSPITVDLLVGAAHQSAADNGASAAAAPLLPNGQYHYEVVFTGADGSTRVHSGRFFAEGGALVSTTTKRAELTGIREELAAASGGGLGTEGYTADDYLSVFDQADDDDTHLYMFNLTTAFTPWELNNMNDSLRIMRTQSSPAMTFLPSGNVGIGTTAPQRLLDVAGGTQPVLMRVRETGVGDDEWDFGIGPAGDFVFDLVAGGPTGVRLFLDESTQEVGVHTTNPDAPFHVVDPSPGGNAAIVESGALQVLRTDGPPANIRFSNSNRSFLFAANQTNQTFEIRDETAGQTPFIIFPAAGVGVLSIRQGNIGVNRLDPAHPIHHNTNARLTATGSWVNASSREIKTAIRGLDSATALATLSELEPMRFAYKVAPDEERVGFIAEDVPALVAESDRKGLSSMNLVAVLTRVVKDQQTQIQSLEARLKALESAN